MFNKSIINKSIFLINFFYTRTFITTLVNTYELRLHSTENKINNFKISVGIYILIELYNEI